SIAVANTPTGPVGVGVALVGGCVGTVVGGASSLDAQGRLQGLGNLISGNHLAGIFADDYWATADPILGTRIEGNFIGSNITGTQALANGGEGILFTAKGSNSTIGGRHPPPPELRTR